MPFGVAAASAACHRGRSWPNFCVRARDSQGVTVPQGLLPPLWTSINIFVFSPRARVLVSEVVESCGMKQGRNSRCRRLNAVHFTSFDFIFRAHRVLLVSITYFAVFEVGAPTDAGTLLFLFSRVQKTMSTHTCICSRTWN